MSGGWNTSQCPSSPLPMNDYDQQANRVTVESDAVLPPSTEPPSGFSFTNVILQGVFTSLVDHLGVQNVQFEELLSLDPAELFALQPIYGVIFLFRYPTDQPYADPDAASPQDGEFDHDAASNGSLFFAAQTIQNACATQALLSVVLNKTQEEGVDIGAALRDFREFTIELPPEFRGEALSNSDLIRETHNSFARSSPFANENERQNPPGAQDDVFHFIAYVPVNGTLYELDGLQRAPISHGACTSETFPSQVVDVLQRRVERYAEDEIHFNLLAVCRDLRARAREFGDDDLLNREEAKRQDWAFENALRRHNFVGFIGELTKCVVQKRLDGGGEASYERWIQEGFHAKSVSEQMEERLSGRVKPPPPPADEKKWDVKKWEF